MNSQNLTKYLSWGFAVVLGASALLQDSRAHALDTAFNEKLVQKPELGRPERGSIAGSLAHTDIGPSELAKGTYSLPLAVDVPSSRGPLLAAVFPSYSPDAGLSEWGMGWERQTSIRRLRPLGDLDYQTDDFVTPWGPIALGDDGFWYPKGLRSRTRLQRIGNDWYAVDEAGTGYTFGAAEAVTADAGIFEWNMTHVRDVNGRETRIDYEANSSGRKFITQIHYGGVSGSWEHRVDFTYESPAFAFVDRRSGGSLTLDRRVTLVSFLTKSRASARFEPVWEYELEYTESSTGPAYYLASATKWLASGAGEPPVTYDYNLPEDRFASEGFVALTDLDAYVADKGALGLQPERVTLVDIDYDGLVDLEHHYDNTLYRQTTQGWRKEELPPPVGNEHRWCRREPSSLNLPRHLARLKPESLEPEVLVTYYRTDRDRTEMYVCTRSGQLLQQQEFAGKWELDANTRLVDINRDLRPDIVRVQRGVVDILTNTSGPSDYSWAPSATQQLAPLVTPEATWVDDFNGDQIPDLIVKRSSSVAVWSGLGRSRFATTAQELRFLSKAGRSVPSLNTYRFTFADPNKDGLADAILSKNGRMTLYTNRGTEFREVSVAGLDAARWSDQLPVVADLAGDGNQVAVFVESQHAFGLQLNGAETGLLENADDGKGTVLWFQYERTSPAPGIIQRPAVLAHLTSDSSGYGATSFAYSYGDAVTHTQGRYLLGFTDVTRVGPLLTERVLFHHDDDLIGIELGTEETDRRTPGLTKRTQHAYDERRYKGVRWWRPKSTREGWSGTSGVEAWSETTFDSYDDELCVRAETRQTLHGRLTTTRRRWSGELNGALHCLSDEVAMAGKHAEARLDFSHRADVGFDDRGHMVSLAAGPKEQPLTLQTVVYDALGRVTEISPAGQGTTRVRYEGASTLIDTIEGPDGVVTEAASYDPLVDSLDGIRTIRGEGAFTEFYRYDATGRLDGIWNSVDGGSEQEPLVRIAYRFARRNYPASIHTYTARQAGAVYVEGIELFTAAQELLANAKRLPAGWAMNKLVAYKRGDGVVETSYRKVLNNSGQISSVPYDSLYADTVRTSYVEEAGFGYDTRTDTTYEKSQVGTEMRSWALEEGLVVETTTTSGRYVTRQARDSEGQVVWFDDAIGGRYRYTHDALGRIVRVEAPDGTKHDRSFDALGRTARVARVDVGHIEYSYDPTTGLSKETRFYDRQGRLERSLVLDYDAAGRVTSEVRSQPGNDNTLVVKYGYDGDQGSAAHAPDQVGRQTLVKTDDFEKAVSFTPQGEISTSSFRFPGWRRVEEELEYYADRKEKRRVHTVYDSAGSMLQRIDQEWLFDDFGRLAEVHLNGEPLAILDYDPEGKLSHVRFSTNEDVEISYDAVTRKPNGQTFRGRDASGAAWESFFDWELDDRGFVATEWIGVAGDALQVDYGYDARGFLSAAKQDQRDRDRYEYSSTGLLTALKDVQSARTLVRKATSITAGGRTYQLDPLGRVTARGDDRFTYGPHGQLATAVVGGAELEYVYDEAGNRLLKRRNGAPEAAYVGGGLLTASALMLPVKVDGRQIGVIRNGQFVMMPFDARGTPVGQEGELSLNTPFGARPEPIDGDMRAAVDFVGFGYDADLGTVRMGVRDYDPYLGQFWTPDPLYFSNLDKCAESPVQCNLYSYASNNPLAYADDDGRELVAALGGAILGGLVGGGIEAGRQLINGESLNWSRIGNSAAGGAVTGALIGATNGLSLLGTAAWSGGSVMLGGTVTRTLNGEQTTAWNYAIDGTMGAVFGIAGHKLTQMLASGRGGGCAICGCFPPGTEVLLADGTSKPIEDVVPGDWVLAADPESGFAPEAAPVTSVSVNSTERLVTVRLDAGEEIEATGEHPFWTLNAGWIAAAELHEGDVLVTDDGSARLVTAVVERSARTQTHNLTVEGTHTFFVLADGVPVLVHNQNAPPPNWGQSPQHGTKVHDDILRVVADRMKALGFKDVRVNQVQVDGQGNVAGRNRPDVQGINPKNGQRVIVEVDTTAKGSVKHQGQVPARDPRAVSVFIEIDPKTGKPVAATRIGNVAPKSCP